MWKDTVDGDGEDVVVEVDAAVGGGGCLLLVEDVSDVDVVVGPSSIPTEMGWGTRLLFVQ